MSLRAKAQLTIDITRGSGAWGRSLPQADKLARRAARAAVAGARLRTKRALELGIRLSDDSELRQLNRAYRGKDKPTNVLSFPAEDRPQRGRPLHLGDVVLSLSTLRREAKMQGKNLAHHFCHLVVHGVLHLTGYDHETEEEATLMEPLEVQVLQTMAIPNPYQFSR